LPWTVEGPRRAPGRYERDAARVQWVAFFADMLEATLRDVIGLGLSVWKHTIAVNAATGRHEITELCRWPIAAVGWTSTPTGLLDYDERGELVASLDRSPCYYAITKGGKRIRLPKPGTSTERWTVVGKGPAPHLYGAVCAVATRYTSDGVSQKSRDNLGTAMGRAVPAYFMPDGVQMVDDAGNPTPEAEAAATVVAGMGTGRSGAVFAGGKLDKYEVGSTTTGFFHEKLLDDLLRVSLAIMGRGGALAKTDAQYQGAAEMDVPESLIRADVELIQRAGSRLLSLVAAMNQEGVAIEVCGNMPDTDQDVRRKDRADRELKRTEILQARRDAGILVTQEDADCLAFDLDLDPLPLAVSAQKAEIFAYDLDGGILTRGTAATIKGLPLPPQPDMTVPEYKAWLDRQAQQPPVAPAQMAPAAAMPPPVADPPMPLLEEEAPQPEDAAARLAEKMTAHGLDRCEHGRPNRCPLCGVERVRDFEPGPDGAPMWKVAWQAIDQPPAGPPAAA
jgi:hypothetical protein